MFFSDELLLFFSLFLFFKNFFCWQKAQVKMLVHSILFEVA